MAAGVLSAKVLMIDATMPVEQRVQANAQAILRVTDGAKWLCVCSGEAMVALFGGARMSQTHMVENVPVTFCNMMDSPGWYEQRGN